MADDPGSVRPAPVGLPQQRPRTGPARPGAIALDLSAADQATAIASVAVLLRRHWDSADIALNVEGTSFTLKVGLDDGFDMVCAADRQEVAPHPDDIALALSESTVLDAPPMVFLLPPAGPARLVYDGSRFDNGDAVTIARRFEHLTAALAREPDRPIGEHDLLGPAETRRILIERNATDHSVPAASVLDLIRRQIRAAPDSPAIVDGGRRLTYAELDRAAAALAHRLRTDFRIGRDDVVLLALPPSAQFIVAMLGVLQCGGAYLPVDLAYPAERIGHIASAAGVRAALIDANETRGASVARLLPPGIVVEPIGLEALDAGPPADFCQAQPDPADAAYVIFTSGSTGQPKGIIQTHRCLANFVAWQVEAAGLGRGRRVLQHAALGFDVSVQEILWTLASGGCLYVAGPDVRGDPRALARLVTEQMIEVVDFPPSMIALLLETPGWFDDATCLTDIISAGEPLRVTPALRDLLRRRPELRLHNHYGPAETHMLASHTMSEAAGNVEEYPPVGSLIWNMRAYVLDERGRAVPDGVMGEVHIGGPGVARGYTHAALDKDAFVTDPFRPGERLYRTGDIGRWRPDGRLEIKGRKDHMIKIRGYRIELAEIEHCLAAHPAVDAAAAFTRAGDGGRTEVHAAVAGRSLRAAELRDRLRQVLPDWMVPTSWWLVDALPSSPNGKLDRLALPGVAAVPMPLGESVCREMTPGEQVVADVWGRLLGIAAFGPDDNLFDLGCDSLSAARGLLRLAERTGVELPLSELFRDPTVAGLARAVRRGGNGTATVKTPPPPIAVRQDGVPLSAVQEAIFIAQEREPGATVYVFAELLAVPDGTSVEDVRLALTSIVERHEVLGCLVRYHLGMPMQMPRATREARFEVSVAPADTTVLDAAHAVAEEQVRVPFDLSREPPLRALLVRGPDGDVLVLVLHHIAADAWSIAVVQRDFGRALDALRRDGRVAFGHAPMRYAEFAARQAQIRSSYAAGVAAARVAARLKGGRPARLPTDRPLTARRSFRGEHFDVPFGTGQAGELVPPTGTTTAIFLVAAMAATLHQITGQSDLVLGTTVSGRAGSATEDAVGPYAELRALRVAIPPGTTWSTLLAYVREQFLLAHDEHEVAFLDIVEALGDRPEAGCSPVFDIGINVVPVRASPGRLGSVWGPGARHHLWLTAMQGADTMSLRVEYSTELFDRETVDAFVDRYRDTARHYATCGDVPVSAPLMPLDQHPADDLGLLL